MSPYSEGGRASRRTIVFLSLTNGMDLFCPFFFLEKNRLNCSYPIPKSNHIQLKVIFLKNHYVRSFSLSKKGQRNNHPLQEFLNFLYLSCLFPSDVFHGILETI